MNTNNLKRFAKEARIKLLDQVSRKLEFVLSHDTAELRGKQKEIDQLKHKIDEQGKEQVIEMVAYTWFNRLMALRFMDANGYTIAKVVTPLPGMTNPEILQNALAGNIESDLKLDRQRLNDLLDRRTAATDAHTEAYKMLLVASCNQWHSAMPFMFERISDYTELLLPDDLLSDYSIIADVRNGMSDEDCRQEELIGWLYQFYIADKKDDVFEGLKKNIKITAENIPAATQLFTPRWIVRYMVENTLGKLWLSLRPNSKLRDHMPYYIEAPEGNAPAPIPEDLLTTTNHQLATKITFLDPCQGSGHVLVYAFDLFTKIYEEEGYNTNEIPALILEHNLFGIDIDERAAQLAAFALTMKARSYYARFLRKPIAPTVFALRNCGFTTNEINQLCAKGLKPVFEKLYLENLDMDSSELFKYLKLLAKKEKTELPETSYEDLVKVLEHFDDEAHLLAWIESHPVKTKVQKIKETLQTGMLDQWVWNYAYSEFAELRYKISLYNQLENIGSLFIPNQSVIEILVKQKGFLSPDNVFGNQFITKIDSAVSQAEYLSRKYHCVVTNPPYMGGKGMNAPLKTFVEANYRRGKTDLMACFIERCLAFNAPNSKSALITQHTWMFLSSYADLRFNLIDKFQFESLLHLGPRTFPEIGGEVVQNASFVFGNYEPVNTTTFIRLTDFENHQLKNDKTIEAIQNPQCGWYYTAYQKDFEQIPGSPVAYWISKQVANIFKKNKKINDFATSIQGMITGNNNTLLRQWFEIEKGKMLIPFEKESITNDKFWVPYNKGGGFRKWYGNQDYVVNWKNAGENFTRNRGTNSHLYFKPYLSWSYLATEAISARFFPEGFLWDVHGSGAFPLDTENTNTILGCVCSKVGIKLLEVLNPTLSFQVENLLAMPLPSFENNLNDKVKKVVQKLIDCGKKDWDSFEVSWNFTVHPLLDIRNNNQSLQEKYLLLKNSWQQMILEMKIQEEENNHLFIEAYGLQNELSSEVKLSDVTLNCNPHYRYGGSQNENDLEYLILIDTLSELISYSLGCMYGRYSLDKPGLILANQSESLQDFLQEVPNPTFVPDEDNIIPVLDGEWFTDDIVGRFKVFLKAAFGEEHFEENLKYIEDTIGKDIRKYFVKDFYNDHIKRYKKRPIYWMFSSPKGHFKALIYMHRYQPDLCSKMLNDYLQAFISKLEAAKQTQTMLNLREDISAREKTAALKEIDKLELMLKDCREYEKTLFTIATQKISIDLDDGVKVNYQKFKEVLVPIKGLEKEEE